MIASAKVMTVLPSLAPGKRRHPSRSIAISRLVVMGTPAFRGGGKFIRQILPGEREFLANLIAETQAIRCKWRVKKTIRFVDDCDSSLQPSTMGRRPGDV